MIIMRCTAFVHIAWFPINLTLPSALEIWLLTIQLMLLRYYSCKNHHCCLWDDRGLISYESVTQHHCFLSPFCRTDSGMSLYKWYGFIQEILWKTLYRASVMTLGYLVMILGCSVISLLLNRLRQLILGGVQFCTS